MNLFKLNHNACRGKFFGKCVKNESLATPKDA